MLLQTKSLIANLITNLFIFLFVYTAISKLLDFKLFQAILSKSPLIGNMAPIVAIGLPIAELSTAAMLFVKRTQQTGLYASLFLMGCFTSYILYMLLFEPQLPCSCGGVLRSMSWKEHFLFNLLFTCLAYLAIQLRKNSIALKKQGNLFPST